MSMLEFDIYMPATWAEDGLLKRMSRTTPREDTVRRSRKGLWVTASTILMYACATVSLASLPNLPNNVAEPMPISDSYWTRSFSAEDYSVPDHYWDRLGNAIKSVVYLPTQDISNDPPTMV